MPLTDKREWQTLVTIKAFKMKIETLKHEENAIRWIRYTHNMLQASLFLNRLALWVPNAPISLNSRSWEKLSLLK